MNGIGFDIKTQCKNERGENKCLSIQQIRL